MSLGTFLDPYWTDWLNLLIRWLHVIAAIAWIGASFYFVLLDQSLEPGAYSLVFHPLSPFFRRVELELALEDGHYHVPLLVSPYSCASYRGS